MKIFKNINKTLLPIKVHYFLWNAGTGPIQPFLSTFARQLGFSSLHVGLIYTILPICGAIFKPIFGAIADKFHCQRKLFLSIQLFTAFAFLAIFYSPPMPGVSQVEVNQILNETDRNAIMKTLQTESYSGAKVSQIKQNKASPATCYFDQCTNGVKYSGRVLRERIKAVDSIVYFDLLLKNNTDGSTAAAFTKLVCNVECSDTLINDLTEVPIEGDAVYGYYQYWVFLALMIFAWVGQAVAVSLADAICFQILGDNPNEFGFQRMFGSLGWGIFAPIGGLMVDSLSGVDEMKKNYTSSFYLCFALLLVDFCVLHFVKFNQIYRSKHIVHDILQILRTTQIFVYLIWCIAIGMCTGLIWNFLFWLIEDLLESKSWAKTLEGIVQLVQTLCGETPLLFFSAKILNTLGHLNTMSLIPCVIGVRYVLYSVISDPWYFLPIELLNGLTYGLFYACMASYASIIAPLGTEATMQGLVGGIFEGVGVSLGSFTSGKLYYDYGGQITFRYFGIAAFIFSILHFIIQFILKKYNNKAENDQLDK